MTRVFVIKAWLAGAGLALGIVGMASERHWLVRIAVALLGAAFLMRFVERRKPASG